MLLSYIEGLVIYNLVGFGTTRRVVERKFVALVALDTVLLLAALVEVPYVIFSTVSSRPTHFRTRDPTVTKVTKADMAFGDSDVRWSASWDSGHTKP